MYFAYLLLLLIPLLAVVYIVWDYRRKTLQRDAVSAERLQDVIGVVTRTARPAEEPQVAGLSAASSITSQSPIVSYVRRERLLSPPQTLLYYLLRSGLPDHVVFSRMTLASVLDTAPAVAEHARNEMARRLAAHEVDFVISDRRMRVVAVLRLIENEAARNEVSSVQRWIAEAGVRYVELDAQALPRKEAIRSVVLSEPAEAPSDASKAALSG